MAMRAKVYCEVTCGNCGGVAFRSGYYKNASTISKLKEYTKDWEWDEKSGMNVCPACQEELKRKPEEVEDFIISTIDAWDATKEYSQCE